MRAMVLCAGYGTRLGDLTREIPKPMLCLGGRPMLEYILCHLKRHGFDEIGINLHFMPDTIRNHFGDGARWGLRIEYSREPQLLGTAGGTKSMEKFLRSSAATEQAAGGSEPFLVHYGDVVTNQDFTALLDFHRRRKALATLLVHKRARSNSIVHIDAEGRIERFLERPSESERRGIGEAWVFSGIAICQGELLDLIPADRFSDFPREVFVPLVKTGRLFAFPLTGKRCAIDSPERLEEARSYAETGDFARN
jgi:NDP-sugar pyrophosphorylase family protein